MTLPDAATLYFWVWELLALAFILTTAYSIHRIDRLSDMVGEGQRRQAWIDVYAVGLIDRETLLEELGDG